MSYTSRNTLITVAILALTTLTISGCNTNDTSTVSRPDAVKPAVVHPASISDAVAAAVVQVVPGEVVANASVIAVAPHESYFIVGIQTRGSDGDPAVYHVNLFGGSAERILLDKQSGVTPCDAWILYMMQCLNACGGAPYCYEWCASGGDGC